MFRFACWYYLLLLVFVPFVYWYIRLYYRSGRSRFLYSDTTIVKGYTGLKARTYVVLPYMLLTALILMIISLAQPQHGTSSIDVLTNGIDIISAIDTSGSMSAEDFKPGNRLDAAKSVFLDFLNGRQNDRIGLIVFSRRSFTLVPLTQDYGILAGFLENVHLGMMEDGTAIGLAIASGVNRLRHSVAKSKVIILLTDGVNNAGEVDPVTAAKLAAAMGIKIYTIGMGTEGGAPVPYEHPIYGKMYYRNPDGSLLLTKLDESTLMQVAAITGGRYFRADNRNKLKEIYHKIDSMEKTEIKSKEYRNYSELANYFLVPALLLLVGYILLQLTWLRKIP